MLPTLKKFIAVIALVLFTTIVTLVDSVVSEATSVRVGIVSAKGAPFAQAITGFKQYLDKNGVEVTYEVFQLDSKTSELNQVIKKIKERKLTLIFSLGSSVTKQILAKEFDIPIIAGMILKQELLERSAKATGVTLDFPLEIQFKWMHKIIPDARTIGVIYNPKENQEKISYATRISKKNGFRIKAIEVSAPKEMPLAFARLSNNADVLWGVSDSVVLTPQTTQQVLLFSFRNRIPLVGLSPAWVKAGALYSLDWDYADIGEQCGEMALNVLQGVDVNSINPAPPRKVLYTLNLKIAKRLKLKISKELIQGAKRVFN